MAPRLAGSPRDLQVMPRRKDEKNRYHMTCDAYGTATSGPT